MYLDYNESITLAESLALERFGKENKIAVFPTSLVLKNIQGVLSDTGIVVGAQNVAWTPKGAYTGAVSAQMFKDVECTYALVGHSERRYVFGESDDDVRKKIEACLDAGLIPVVCIGETKEDKDEDKRDYRLKKQLMKAFEGLDLNNKEVIIAYEPVWAISKAGVGEPCTPADADDVQGWIKNELKQYTDNVVPVLYGGSVNQDNVVSYLSQPMIDGVLVGNASAKLESFVSLIKEAESL